MTTATIALLIHPAEEDRPVDPAAAKDFCDEIRDVWNDPEPWGRLEAVGLVRPGYGRDGGHGSDVVLIEEE